MPRVPGDYRRPLTGPEFEKAKRAEQQRKALDPSYITADEAAQIPPELRDSPEVRGRVSASREHWPEEQASMAAAMPHETLPGGEGETSQSYSVDGADLMGGEGGG